MDQTYISLDLETTGLNPNTNEIIEIGAVKFQGDQVIDTFHSLVNPQRPLPYRIQLLCGITRTELADAPAFSDIASELISFLGTEPIVGHNISFDLNFLAKKGIKLTNPTYDTCELSTILLFQLSDYSLASVNKHLGLSIPQHRSLPDAIATKELFVTLLARAYQLVEELRQVLKAPDEESMTIGLQHVLYRTEKRTNVPMRKLHDSLQNHLDSIVALGKHHPPTGRIEALNNNWETLVRQGRGYRDLDFLLLKLRFAIVNPIAHADGLARFLALGLPTPYAKAA